MALNWAALGVASDAAAPTLNLFLIMELSRGKRKSRHKHKPHQLEMCCQIISGMHHTAECAMCDDDEEMSEVDIYKETFIRFFRDSRC